MRKEVLIGGILGGVLGTGAAHFGIRDSRPSSTVMSPPPAPQPERTTQYDMARERGDKSWAYDRKDPEVAGTPDEGTYARREWGDKQWDTGRSTETTTTYDTGTPYPSGTETTSTFNWSDFGDTITDLLLQVPTLVWIVVALAAFSYLVWLFRKMLRRRAAA